MDNQEALTVEKEKVIGWPKNLLVYLSPGPFSMMVLGFCLIAIVVLKIVHPEVKETSFIVAFVILLLRSFFGGQGLK